MVVWKIEKMDRRGKKRAKEERGKIKILRKRRIQKDTKIEKKKERERERERGGDWENKKD